MNLIIEYISSLAPWVYGLCGLIALFYLFRVRAIRLERRQAIFSLEREQAARELAKITYRVAAIIFLMIVTYTVSDVLGRAVEIEQSLGQGSTPQVGGEDQPAPVETPIPSPTPLPVESEVEGQVELRTVPVCDSDSAIIQYPGEGQEIAGEEVVSGTAAYEDFARYEIEIAPGSDPAEDDFTELGVGRNQVRSGELQKYDASAYITGPYTIRLRVLDNTGTYVGACQVNVRVVSS